jgi:hypothetical protein
LFPRRPENPSTKFLYLQFYENRSSGSETEVRKQKHRYKNLVYLFGGVLKEFKNVSEVKKQIPK